MAARKANCSISTILRKNRGLLEVYIKSNEGKKLARILKWNVSAEDYSKVGVELEEVGWRKKIYTLARKWRGREVEAD